MITAKEARRLTEQNVANSFIMKDIENKIIQAIGKGERIIDYNENELSCEIRRQLRELGYDIEYFSCEGKSFSWILW